MNTDYLKEALKLETERLKIFAAYFAGIIAVLGNVAARGEFTIYYQIISYTSLFLIIFIGILLFKTSLKCSNFLNLLKKETE
ncbi:MAG: hypothetical protein H7329_10690 [Opitutaceae bacterium]|nr:hypothetical protein [Cytophagales bacterium]